MSSLTWSCGAARGSERRKLPGSWSQLHTGWRRQGEENTQLLTTAPLCCCWVSNDGHQCGVPVNHCLLVHNSILLNNNERKLPSVQAEYRVQFLLGRTSQPGWKDRKRSNSPFVVLAVEETVEDVTEGADVVEVVQDDHSGELCVRLLRVALLSQVGQVLTQILGEGEHVSLFAPWFRCSILKGLEYMSAPTTSLFMLNSRKVLTFKVNHRPRIDILQKSFTACKSRLFSSWTNFYHKYKLVKLHHYKLHFFNPQRCSKPTKRQILSKQKTFFSRDAILYEHSMAVLNHLRWRWQKDQPVHSLKQCIIAVHRES